MNLRADPEFKFLLKYLIIGLGCLAFAGWSIYDGFYAYPKKIPRSQAWADLKAEPDQSETEFREKWKKLSKEKGWSSDRVSKDESVDAIEQDIIYQYVFLVLGLVVGLPCLIWYLRNRNSWIESTDDGLRSSSGQECKLSQINKFDKKKWEKKGIGVLHYKADDGSDKKFVVDDLKYDRKTTDEIVRWIEANIPAEMIVNGKPDVAPAEDEEETVPTED